MTSVAETHWRDEWVKGLKRIAALEEFVRDVANNYDCDEDAHRLGTHCRACEAKKLLNPK